MRAWPRDIDALNRLLDARAVAMSCPGELVKCDGTYPIHWGLNIANGDMEDQGFFRGAWDARWEYVHDDGRKRIELSLIYRADSTPDYFDKWKAKVDDLVNTLKNEITNIDPIDSEADYRRVFQLIVETDIYRRRVLSERYGDPNILSARNTR